MEGAPLNLILNVVILVLLGLTIVYAARLSLQLKRLRDSRSDLDRVVRELIKNLDRADRTVAGLKESAREAGGDLQSAIDRAIAISDELQLITDSGDRLAARLESLVGAARPIATGSQTQSQPQPQMQAQAQQPAQQQPKPAAQAPMAATEASSSYVQHLRKLDPADDKIQRGAFAIRDTDAERGIDPLAPRDDVEEDAAQGLYSEAERDLFRAMKGKSKR